MSVALTFYGNTVGFIGDGTIVLGRDSFDVTLHDATYIPQAYHASFDDVITSEITQGSGYTSGGKRMATTFTNTGGNVKLSSASVSWVASGGNITSPAWAIIHKVGYSNGVSNPLLGYVALSSNSPGMAISIPEGHGLSLNINQLTGLVNIF